MKALWAKIKRLMFGEPALPSNPLRLPAPEPRPANLFKCPRCNAQLSLGLYRVNAGSQRGTVECVSCGTWLELTISLTSLKVEERE